MFDFNFLFGGNAAEAVSVHDAYERLKAMKKRPLLLDVRTEGEYFGPAGHIKGSTLIPVQVLAQRAQELLKHKDEEIFIICNSGNRTRMASQILKNFGFTKMVDIAGGMMAWNQAGLPKNVFQR